MSRLNHSTLVALIAIILGASVILFAPTNQKSSEIEDPVFVRQVELISVLETTNETSPLQIVGTVESKNEARIRAETQGRITTVHTKLGETVTAGAILAEIENGFEQAAVTQAEGAVEAARANLTKVTGGAREEEQGILRANFDNAAKGLAEAKTLAANAIRNSFAAADDVIRNRIDPMFTDPQETNPQINFSVKDSQLEINLENNRFLIERMLKSWRDNLGGLDGENFSIASFLTAENNTNQIRDFLDALALAINSLVTSNTLPQTTIDLWKSNVVSSRNIINSTLNAISNAKDIFNNRESNWNIAREQLAIGKIGGRAEEVQAMEAGLKQATGALRAAQVNFSKTIIRTPITGTINVFDIKAGDFVSAFQPVIVVSNNNALEITAFITDKDRDLVKIGAPVTIEKRWPGIVTTVAPAVDEATKKVEVKIGLTDQVSGLTNGQSVRLDITRVVDPITTNEPPIIVPISALKVDFDKIFVFTLDRNRTLVTQPVTIGPILGEHVVIEAGLARDSIIIKDARGLEAGEKVAPTNL